MNAFCSGPRKQPRDRFTERFAELQRSNAELLRESQEAAQRSTAEAERRRRELAEIEARAEDILRRIARPGEVGSPA